MSSAASDVCSGSWCGLAWSAGACMSSKSVAEQAAGRSRWAKSHSSGRCAVTIAWYANFPLACGHRCSKPISTASPRRCSASSRCRRDRRSNHLSTWRRVIQSLSRNQSTVVGWLRDDDDAPIGHQEMPRTNRSIQVEAEMLGNITSGRWPAGYCIGAHRDLNLTYRCTRSDMNRALYALRTRGLIEARAGKPSNWVFVRTPNVRRQD